MIVSAVACGGSVSSVEGSSGGTSGTSGTSGNTSGGTSGNTSGGTSGTSGTSGSTGTIPQGDIDLCDGDGPSYDRLKGITPAPGLLAVDYMELRDEYATTLPPASPPHVIAKSGTLCANAKDKAKCEASFTGFRSTNGWNVTSFGLEAGPRKRYLLWQAQDTIEPELDMPSLKDFLVPIENAKDAALLVTATDQYRVACDTPGVKHARKTDAGWEISVQSGHTCGKGTKLEGHVVEVTTDGTVTLKSTTLIKEGDPGCAIGRRPDGLAPCAAAEGPSAVGRFFADAAHLEAASVFAFERLATELAELGAPEELIAAAEASQEDEVRHTKMTSALASRFGAACTEPRVAPPEKRTPFAIALENAVEGCVRETYGALVAHWQARAANDTKIGSVMERIAADETNHATLAWNVAAWLEPRLSEEERAVVEDARRRALAELRSELAREPHADLVALAGMPDATRAVALLDALEASLAA